MATNRIIFSEDTNILALLNKRKTQTRRLPTLFLRNAFKHRTDLAKARPKLRKKYRFLKLANGGECGPVLNPYGLPGDTLWVRENLRLVNGIWVYRADSTPIPMESIEQREWASRQKLTYCSPLLMPRWASRISIEVKDIYIDRLHSINYHAAACEGVEHLDFYFKNYLTGAYEFFDNPVASFKTLWQSINGVKSWDANDWVWVISFRGIPRPSIRLCVGECQNL